MAPNSLEIVCNVCEKNKQKTFTDIKELKDMLSTQVHFLPAV